MCFKPVLAPFALWSTQKMVTMVTLGSGKEHALSEVGDKLPKLTR